MPMCERAPTAVPPDVAQAGVMAAAWTARDHLLERAESSAALDSSPGLVRVSWSATKSAAVLLRYAKPEAHAFELNVSTAQSPLRACHWSPQRSSSGGPPTGGGPSAATPTAILSSCRGMAAPAPRPRPAPVARMGEERVDVGTQAWSPSRGLRRPRRVGRPREGADPGCPEDAASLEPEGDIPSSCAILMVTRLRPSWGQIAAAKEMARGASR